MNHVKQLLETEMANKARDLDEQRQTVGLLQQQLANASAAVAVLRSEVDEYQRALRLLIK